LVQCKVTGPRLVKVSDPQLRARPRKVREPTASELKPPRQKVGIAEDAAEPVAVRMVVCRVSLVAAVAREAVVRVEAVQVAAEAAAVYVAAAVVVVSLRPDQVARSSVTALTSRLTSRIYSIM
jgi:hypothetical protein